MHKYSLLFAIALICCPGNHNLFAQGTAKIVKHPREKSLIALLDERKLSQKKVNWVTDAKMKTKFVDELVVGLVDDSDLETISQLRRLRVLSCTGIISSDGIKKLLKLTNLKQLSICSSKKMSNDSISVFGKMSSIQRLDIRFMRASHDIDLQPLAKLAKLQHLQLPSSKYVDDDEIKKISNLNNLVFLRASDCAISDIGIDFILKLKQLEVLDIGGTQVTDQGVSKLARLARLKYLNVDGIRVHQETIDALKNANDNDVKIIPYR